MQFSSLSDFIAMDGHGFYVWLSYGFAFALLALLVWFSKLSNKKIRQNIAKKLRRDEKLKAVLLKQAKQAEQEQDINF